MLGVLYRLAGRLRRLVRDQYGQDLVEYALLVGFLAVSAGAFIPGVADPIKIIFVKVSFLLSPECIGSPGNAGSSNGCGPPTTPGGFL